MKLIDNILAFILLGTTSGTRSRRQRDLAHYNRMQNHVNEYHMLQAFIYARDNGNPTSFTQQIEAYLVEFAPDAADIIKKKKTKSNNRLRRFRNYHS